jgi:hypothetical protein
MPTSPRERAEGFRYLSQAIPLALELHLESRDPHFPVLMHYFDPIRKQAGDNSDARRIDGAGRRLQLARRAAAIRKRFRL